MKPPLADIPTHVVHGGTAADRAVAIERLIAACPRDGLVSVFRPEPLALDAGKRLLDDHVVVRRAPTGCPCCIGSVAFRIALVQSLRTDRPARLIIEFAPASHTESLDQVLASASFAGVLNVVERIDLGLTGRAGLT